MPAAMHLTVLMSLFAVTVCTNNSSTTTQVTEITTSAKHLTSVVWKNDTNSSRVKTSDITHTQPPTTHQISTEVTSDKVSSTPPPSTSLQTSNGTAVTHPSPLPQTTTTNQTSNETVSHRSTVPAASASPNVTATTTVNATSQALPHEWEKGDLVENPGLVAVICIFCIVLILVLVVAMVKCTQSRRSNFERLEDVPMGKMNEESPFAHYSK
ncbi:protein CIST1-like [Thunnus thynnus]|uniref:protein CIST1-like n=1 Tax=Thunnus thynnus TaxID=8237 RepID=UPI003528D711